MGGSSGRQYTYASFGRRVGAYLIDGIPPVLIYLVGGATLLAAVTGRSQSRASFALILFLALPIAYFIVLWVMAAKGSSPGKALLGIRVIRQDSGRFPGAGLGLGRILLMGLLIGCTLYIAGFSPLWDSSGRRKGWWDTAVGTVVVNKSALAVYRAAVNGNRPAAGYAAAATATPTEPAVNSYPSPAAPVTANVDAGDVPAWDLPPVRPASPPAKVPAAGWSDRPADSFPAPAAIALSASTQSDSALVVPLPAAPAPLGASAIVAGPTAVASAADSSTDEPWGSPASAPGVITGIPGLTPVRRETSTPDDIVEHTRMATGLSDRPTSAEWTLDFDDGRSLPLVKAMIIGRDPAATNGESSAELLALGDEGRSVSKTHLRLDVGPAGVQVIDRHSSNGVTVITAGVAMACVPGVSTAVPADSTVRFGDRHLVARRT